MEGSSSYSQRKNTEKGHIAYLPKHKKIGKSRPKHTKVPQKQQVRLNGGIGEGNQVEPCVLKCLARRRQERGRRGCLLVVAAVGLSLPSADVRVSHFMRHLQDDRAKLPVGRDSVCNPPTLLVFLLCAHRSLQNNRQPPSPSRSTGES
ncbi:unnamed protein product [Arctogadus glacialis]